MTGARGVSGQFGDGWWFGFRPELHRVCSPGVTHARLTVGVPGPHRWCEGAKSTVSDVSGQAAATAARLGLSAGDNVGEIGYDDDVDFDLRDAVEAITTTELLEEDGDLTDALVDANTLLADTGVIWLFTPKTGRDGYVEPSEIIEATQTAGLAQTTSFGVGA